MSESKLERVAVLGAGVLGGQISWHCAIKGKRVTQYDLFPEAIDKVKRAHETYADIYRKRFGLDDAAIADTHSRMSYSSDLHQAVADVDLVIEAVPEIPAVKTEVYETMAPSLSAHTLVATNSSTLLPRDFAEATGRPEKYCSLHFANLLWSLNLVEIMGHEKVASETLVAATRFAIEIGMVPIPVGKEQNGYVLNSWLVALLKTSLALVVDGVCTAEDVDRTFLIANRPAKVGPFGMADLIGMGTLKNVLEHWGDELDDARLRRCAAYVQENFIDRGYMGTVSGQGFYTYPNPAYADPGFLSVPSMDQAEAIAARSVLK